VAKARSTILALIFLLCCPLTAPAEQLQLKLAHIGEPGSLYDLQATEFARRVNAELGDMAYVTVYGSSQLGDDTKLLAKLKTGEVTFSLPSTVMNSVHPCFGVFEMPFMVRNRDHVRAIRRILFRGALRGYAQEHGLFLVGMWENGFRQLTNDVRPILAPDDLQSIKLRTPKGIWRQKMFEAYGAKTIPTGLEVVYSGLKDRSLDGQESPLSVIETFKFYDVQHYLSLSSHVYAPMYLTADSAIFAKLPARVKTVLEKTAFDIQDWSLDRGKELDMKSRQRLATLMKVNEIDPLAFAMPSLKIYEEFAKTQPQCKRIFKIIFELTPRCDSLACGNY
jgi:tripartite ATP-independent transporter DctP family solute receptor